MREVIENRLYVVSEKDFDEEALSKVTVLVDLSGDRTLIMNPEKYLYLFWMTEDNVDQGMFEGLVRLCASAMKGRDQRVLIVGNNDTIDTIAACILREYLGCPAEAAIGIIRDLRPRGMNKSGYIETVQGYKPS